MSRMMIDSGCPARRARAISRSAISWNVRRLYVPVSGSIVAMRTASPSARSLCRSMKPKLAATAAAHATTNIADWNAFGWANDCSGSAMSIAETPRV